MVELPSENNSSANGVKKEQESSEEHSKRRTSLEMRVTDVLAEGEWEVGFNELLIRQKIGEGSFGCVRSAIWRGTEVALKILYDKTLDLTQFYMELLILTRIHHPNILQVLGCCTLSIPYAIVLEHMPNGSLQDYIKTCHGQQNDIKQYQKYKIVKDVSKGLAYLHNRKPNSIIHRDLKPSNILLTTSMTAKIADFGISSLKSKPEEFYKMTGETGTYSYMAPEVLQSKAYNCKVDMWSFGLLVYALFIEEPFSQCKLAEIFRRIVSSNVKQFLKLTSLHEKIKIIVNKTIVRDPEHRWDSLYLVNFCNVELNDSESEYSEHKSKMCCF